MYCPSEKLIIELDGDPLRLTSPAGKGNVDEGVRA
jgi:hypothetical protein